MNLCKIWIEQLSRRSAIPARRQPFKVWNRSRNWPLSPVCHLVLDLVDEQTAAEIMGHCEDHLPG
jgi:hypothetical protein